jgi:radical SAM superfamily enzyme YgiQ (UPF0313 family)
MELPRRKPDDVYLPDGEFKAIIQRLRERANAHDLRIGIVNAFDYRTRMLPYYYADKRMAPCSVRTLGDALYAAGFEHTRIILQQWTPNFRPSLAVLDGRPLDILLVSAMQVHAEPSYKLVREAHRLGDARPLIVAGGPKAIYEPADYLNLGPEPGIGADCSVTGEVYVLLHLLETMLDHREEGESARQAFERARLSGALKEVPGLCYRSPDSSVERPVAVNTGVQRLLQNLDEMPLPDAGYRLLESPHRGRRLREKPFPIRKLRWQTPIASLIATQGCKFNCPYCPIPAVNQRTWRYKSPKRLAEEIKHIHEEFGICTFFGTDDNFFNRRDTVVELMTELSETKTRSVPLAQKIKFYTEATQFDVYKNKDLLALCRKGGLRGIWFGIEDITAELVNKGQNAGKTAELFARMHEVGIMPMAMMIHSDCQPLVSRRGDLSGLINQAGYLFKAGAVSYQCTHLGPAVGTRDFEKSAESGSMFERVAGQPVPEAYQDGNHVVTSNRPRPWLRQINPLLGYIWFYNPINMIRTVFQLKKNSVSPKRIAFQIIGQAGLFYTIPKTLYWSWRLLLGPVRKFHGVPKARMPMIDVHTGELINWGIDHPITPDMMHACESVPAAGGESKPAFVPATALETGEKRKVSA